MKHILLALALTPAALFAEGWELYGHIGAGKAYDDEGNIGYGAAAGVGLGKRVTRRWSVEGEWTRFHHERDFSFASSFRSEGYGNFFMANGLLHFNPEGRIQPFVLGGAGILKYETQNAGFGFNFGGGVKGYLTDHWFIRPEFRVQIGQGTRRNGGPEPPISQGRVQVGVGYRW